MQGLAERAAQRRKARYRAIGKRSWETRSEHDERTQLLAWFAMQPTQSLREFKRAIEAARLARKLRNHRAGVRRYHESRKNLSQ